MRLITLGDSWVYGVGTEYKEGMTETEYRDMAWKESKNCFRHLVSDQLGLENLNLSVGGSSNQTQFRLALETFFGDNKIAPTDSDVVLWGITSVFRTELWYTDQEEFKSLFLPDGSAVGKILATRHHNEDEEIKILGHQMSLWNSYFKSKNIKNYWFNIFNDHSWGIEIDNLLFQDSSMLSMLINDTEKNDIYHISDWQFTDRKIKLAKELKLVNPISGHPTIKGHKMIADILIKEMQRRAK